MAIKDSGKVTITLDRTTVEKLRSEKGGMAWDAFMLDLIEWMKQGVRARCVVCRKGVGSVDVDLSPSMLAKRLGWREVSVRGRPDSIGFLCDKCGLEMEKMEEKGEIEGDKKKKNK
ncbi:MAG: hypothetical protein IMF19_03745 [Proteobacteria bacterium]|nr:hypothetical protein [Pseudomonadota bacterium]